MRTRREFIRGATALVVAAAGPVNRRAHAQATSAPPRPKTRLILLGTGGGPRPRANRMSSAQVIIANDVPYVVDCANGVSRQLVRAGVALAKVRHVFTTHHHSDHNADYGTLLLMAWASGLRTRVDTWGPPPLAKITRLFFEMSAPDIDVRVADEGRIPLVPLVHPHEITRDGPVMQDENVTVTAARVAFGEACPLEEAPRPTVSIRGAPWAAAEPGSVDVNQNNNKGTPSGRGLTGTSKGPRPQISISQHPSTSPGDWFSDLAVLFFPSWGGCPAEGVDNRAAIAGSPRSGHYRDAHRAKVRKVGLNCVSDVGTQHLGNRAGHDDVPGLKRETTSCQVIGEPDERVQRITQHLGAGVCPYGYAVVLVDNLLACHVEVRDRLHGATEYDGFRDHATGHKIGNPRLPREDEVW